MEFRGLYHVKALNFLHVDIGTEWNLEKIPDRSTPGSSSVDIGTEWNLEFATIQLFAAASP